MKKINSGYIKIGNIIRKRCNPSFEVIKTAGRWHLVRWINTEFGVETHTWDFNISKPDEVNVEKDLK